MGPWPALLENPKLEVKSSEQRENFTQQRITLQSSATQSLNGYLLIPQGTGPFPAVLVVYYDPETSIGTNPDHLQRDFAYQLTKRGFVTLSIGSPGGDARKPELGQAVCQPLSYLAYVAANGHTSLAHHPAVAADRIGVVGHSYGGKWAMFASCLYDKFAAAVWSDPGIVFEEARGNINYWEPWYLGLETGKPPRKRGLITKESPRTGTYKMLIESGHDLHELHALMAPRPFLVSGGAEDTPKRWVALNHMIAVNNLLGAHNRVAMTNRKDHPPTEESNAQLYAFFEYALK
jgi:dienelactone hydrolase